MLIHSSCHFDLSTAQCAEVWGLLMSPPFYRSSRGNLGKITEICFHCTAVDTRVLVTAPERTHKPLPACGLVLAVMVRCQLAFQSDNRNIWQHLYLVGEEDGQEAGLDEGTRGDDFLSCSFSHLSSLLLTCNNVKTCVTLITVQQALQKARSVCGKDSSRVEFCKKSI